MKVFVIGATGFVGGHLACGLVAEGHHVQGLARTDEAVHRLRRDDIDPVRGDFDHDRTALLVAAHSADAVIVAAQLDPEAELELVTTLLDTVEELGATFVFTPGQG